ncbi:hypothetical protein Kpho02_47940 [Kitasatospora phosalacinea]|uniref:Uncharacterized protein n=1 Tax=Kitasatospora phosalacinea TaxID=2065 RepID=A0A9W6Q8W0_9ACTN|nr:hypothetical protein [Kitasatospora phosalacinea]GLW72495.1 hypothetical protein Kpho02_47940 [Kitasatospora phosalacinea]
MPRTPLAPGWEPLLAAPAVDRRLGLTWLSGLGSNRAAPVEVLLALLDLDETDCLYRPDLPAAVLDAAATHPELRVRRRAAETARLSPEQWEHLVAATPEPELRRRFAELAEQRLAARRRGRGVAEPPRPDARPPATAAGLTALAAAAPDIAPESLTTALWWVGALHGDGAAMRLLAASPKLLVRRSVARAPRLPADVAELLARDEDRVVRLFLAESCADAPAGMLLEVASWWKGSFSFPDCPRSHPNFPRAGLLRFAADPNPLLRALVPDDPKATAADVERLAADPDPTVRRAAAEDRRLSPATVSALAADPDAGVRYRARANPVLPVADLVALLLEPRTAEHAVRNPAVPLAVMHRMLALGAPHAATAR